MRTKVVHDLERRPAQAVGEVFVRLGQLLLNEQLGTLQPSIGRLEETLDSVPLTAIRIDDRLNESFPTLPELDITRRSEKVIGGSAKTECRALPFSRLVLYLE